MASGEFIELREHEEPQRNAGCNPFTGLSRLSAAAYRRSPSFAARRDQCSGYEGNNPESDFLGSIDRVGLASLPLESLTVRNGRPL